MLCYIQYTVLGSQSLTKWKYKTHIVEILCYNFNKTAAGKYTIN